MRADTVHNSVSDGKPSPRDVAAPDQESLLRDFGGTLRSLVGSVSKSPGDSDRISRRGDLRVSGRPQWRAPPSTTSLNLSVALPILQLRSVPRRAG